MSQKNRERVRAALFLGLSMGCALIATLLVWMSFIEMSQELEHLQREDARVTVIVAAHTLGQGHAIGQEDIRFLEIPEDYVVSTAVTDPTRVLARVPTERILAGEMIREERLAAFELGDSMAAIIPAGMRALSVNIAGGAAVSGFLEPGNHVDVLVTTDETDEAPAQTTTLLQAVRILAVDDKVGSGGRSDGKRRKPAVTLMLTPDHAEQLTHAVEHGQVSLVLRSDVDMVERQTDGATTDEMLGRDGTRMDVETYKRRQAEIGDGGTLFIRGEAESRE